MDFPNFPAGPLAGPVSFVITVTPELAGHWLADRVPNRHISRRRVETWARDIVAGNYHLNHQGIAFRWHEGRWRIDDGQHRLMAVVQCGIPIRIFAAFGADPGGVDQGRARQFADQITIEKGLKSAYGLSAVARSVTVWLLRGEPPHKGGAFVASWDEMSKTMEDHPCMAETMPLVDRMRKGCGLRVSVGGWFRFVLAHSAGRDCQSPDDDWFLDRLTDGGGLALGHPALTLRNRIISDRSFRQDEFRLAAGCVYAWNAYRERRELLIIKIPATLTPAAFPEARLPSA